MFTGIIECIGQVARMDRATEGASLEIRSQIDLTNTRVGDSIAVNGVCLTVTRSDGQSFVADAAFETLDKTTLGHLAAGAKVHLERALALGGRLDGHLVQGHVDAVGHLQTIERRGTAWALRVSVPSEMAPYIVAKGSIAIDGVSLTVNDCGPGWLTIGVVPHTGSRTLLPGLRPGQALNLETDVLGKYVVQALRLGAVGTTSGTLEATLKRNGYWK